MKENPQIGIEFKMVEKWTFANQIWLKTLGNAFSA